MMSSITGTPIWKVLMWIAAAYLVAQTAIQLWNDSDTWFVLTFLEQMWDWTTSGIQKLKNL